MRAEVPYLQPVCLQSALDQGKAFLIPFMIHLGQVELRGWKDSEGGERMKLDGEHKGSKESKELRPRHS